MESKNQDLVAITRDEFKRAHSEWNVNHDDPWVTEDREFKHKLWRANIEAKLAYFNALWESAQEGGVFELMGESRGKEIYVNKKPLLARTQDEKQRMAHRNYEPGSLLFIVDRDSRDKAYDKYGVMYFQGERKLEDFQVQSLVPWKSQERRRLQSVAHIYEGINREDMKWASVMFYTGLAYYIGYGCAAISHPDASVIDSFNIANPNMVAIIGLIFGGLGLRRRSTPRTLDAPPSAEYKPYGHLMRDKEALYILDSALPVMVIPTPDTN
jgi:hypothetical protein